MKFALITWFMLFVRLVHAQPPIKLSNDRARNGTNLMCVPFGTCEVCPDDALHEPFCQPFGNRRLMHCVPESTTIRPPSPLPMHDQSKTTKTKTIQGEIPAWESCGRIVQQERADFYEFLACNIFLAIVAVTVVLARSKRLEAIQARQLAARIGLVRSVPSGWTNL